MAGPAPAASYPFGTGADCHARLTCPACSGDHVELLPDDDSFAHGLLDPAPSPSPLNELSLQHYGLDCAALPLLGLAACTSCPPSFTGSIITPVSPLPLHDIWTGHSPTVCKGLDGDTSILERQESFNFPSLLDEINTWGSLPSFNMPPASVMAVCNNQDAVAHAVDQVCDDSVGFLQHFNQPKLPQLDSCLPTSSPTCTEGTVYAAGAISNPKELSVNDVTSTSSVLHQTSSVHLEAPALPALFLGIVEAQNSHDQSINTLAWAKGGQDGCIKLPRELMSPFAFPGVAAEEGPQESFHEVEDMGFVHGGNQAATRFNKTQFYREMDRLAWRRHGQALGVKSKKQPRSATNISSAACADPFEDKDRNCDATKVKFRVRTRNIILDDGFLWFKYGEKAISGHTHPRSYLKCAASAWSGCKALKRVQRCSNMEDFVEFMYLGTHNHTPY
ncbi:hypothetical protein GOP47_0027589 [Adiantum capillus-veneris]|nr:hypothetical protein GOP47_0027589 [Adiantum capillus-veneris]